MQAGLLAEVGFHQLPSAETPARSSLRPMSLMPSNNLNDLMGELERRMTGGASLSGLQPDLAASIPDANTYVVVLFDGLGIAQLDHPDATIFRESNRGVLRSPFPTTTSVALSTVATGLTPFNLFL